jgi:YD repeat-containing protein
VVNDTNRVLTEDHTARAGTEVTYVYDVCLNGVGRTCSATTTDGGTHYTYFANGAINTERKIVNSTAYTTEYSYDVQGNQILITYPDSSQVQYNYNSAGQLESVSQKESGVATSTDIILDYDYSPLGQITYEKYKNGVETTNDYDEGALYRLKTKTTLSP